MEELTSTFLVTLTHGTGKVVSKWQEQENITLISLQCLSGEFPEKKFEIGGGQEILNVHHVKDVTTLIMADYEENAIKYATLDTLKWETAVRTWMGQTLSFDNGGEIFLVFPRLFSLTCQPLTNPDKSVVYQATDSQICWNFHFGESGMKILVGCGKNLHIWEKGKSRKLGESTHQVVMVAFAKEGGKLMATATSYAFIERKWEAIIDTWDIEKKKRQEAAL